MEEEDTMDTIILASASPRRTELLNQVGLSHRIQVSHVEEHTTQEEPGEIVMELSFQKAVDVAESLKEQAVVIGADTIVYYDGEMMGKPESQEDAFEMLNKIQGNTHSVFTGVTMIYTGEDGIKDCKSFFEETKVTMFNMTNEEIWDYIATKEPMDKAGAYGIQGRSAAFIRSIQGDYNNVVGLPVSRVYQELKGKTREKGYAGAIFDLDGTIADSLYSIAVSANLSLEHLGFSPQPVDQYRFYAGDGAEELLKRALRAAGDEELVYIEELKKTYKEYFAVHCMDRVKPFPGIVELLTGLKQAGIRIGVLSNKPDSRAREVVEQLFGVGFFDYVQGQKENMKRKPSPQGALNIARIWNISPSNCLYVGDTDTDMQTGKQSGMYTIGVTWGFREEEELLANGADCLVQTPDEILQIGVHKGEQI